MVSRHRHLHRLDDTLKVLNAVQHLLYGCYACAVRRLLPLALNTHKLVAQAVKTYRQVLLKVLQRPLGCLIERHQALIQGLAYNIHQIFPGQLSLNLNRLKPGRG